MISKLIAWGSDRDEAIQRMRRALYEYTIVGIKSNIPFHQAVMENERFVKGELGTHFIDREDYSDRGHETDCRSAEAATGQVVAACSREKENSCGYCSSSNSPHAGT